MAMESCGNKWGMVIAGRGARACDMCGREKARWYCAADEAYLCETCDASVHSANAVARRHERVKLGPTSRTYSTTTSSSSAIGKPSPAAYDGEDDNRKKNKVDVDARNFEQQLMMDANTLVTAEQWQLYETHVDATQQVINIDIHHPHGLQQQQPMVKLLPPCYDVHVDAQLQVPCSDAINRAHDTAHKKKMAKNIKKKKKKKKKKMKKTAGCANASNSSATSWRSSKKRTPRCINGKPKTAPPAPAFPYPDLLVNDGAQGNFLSAALYGAIHAAENGVTNHVHVHAEAAVLLDRANRSIDAVKQEILPLTDDDSISLYDLLGMGDPDDVVCMHDIGVQQQPAQAHPHDINSGQPPISSGCQSCTISIQRNRSYCSCGHNPRTCSAAVGATKVKVEDAGQLCACLESCGVDGACAKAESGQLQEGGGQENLQLDVHDPMHKMLDETTVGLGAKDQANQLLLGNQSSAAATNNIHIWSIGSDKSSCSAHCNPSNIVNVERTPDLNLGTHHTRQPNSCTAAHDNEETNPILNFDASKWPSPEDHAQPTATETPRQLSPGACDKIMETSTGDGGECFHPISAIEDDTDDIDTFDVMELCSKGTSFDDDDVVKCGDDIHQLEGRLSGADLTWKVGSDYAGVDDHDEPWSYYADGCSKFVLDEAAAAGSPFKACGNATTSRLMLAAAAAASYPCHHHQQLHLELKMEEMDGGEDPYEGVRFTNGGEMCLDVVDDASPSPASAVMKIKLLSLRLDYDEIIHAWCDKGPLWMDGQRPQIVPDINSCCHHLYGRRRQQQQQHASFSSAAPPPHQATTTKTEREYVSALSTKSSTTSNASPPQPVVASGHTEATTGLVPVLSVQQQLQLSSSSSSNSSSLDTTATACATGGGGAAGVREARVLRYKEKRRTRLFSKRIRYEVRKLNAERRPRMKGRFVKRSAIAGI